MNWLISKKYLRMENGKYLNLTVTGKQKSKKKQRYVPDSVADKLRYMK